MVKEDLRFGTETELFQLIISQTSDAILVTDSNLNENGPSIVFANPAFCDLTGYQIEELIGKSAKIMFGRDTDRKTLQNLKNCVQRGIPYSSSTIHYRKDGSKYHAEWTVSPVKDPAGNITNLLSIQRDITDKIQREEFAARRLRSEMGLTAASQILMSTRHESFTIERAIEHFLVLTGAERIYYYKRTSNPDVLFLEAESKNPFSSSTLAETYPEISLASRFSRWKGFLYKNEIIEFKTEQLSESERYFCQGRRSDTIFLFPLKISGEWIGFLGMEFFENPTGPEEQFTFRTFADLIGFYLERKSILEELKTHKETLEETVDKRTKELSVQKEKAEAASTAKSEFLANMSHELRTPLNAIIGLSKLIQPSMEDPSNQRYLDVIHTSGLHLLGLINDILDLSKLNAGKSTFYFSELDLRKEIEQVVSVLEAEILRKHIHFVWQETNVRNPLISGDPKRIRQIFLNLVGNAVKFTAEQGSIYLSITQERGDWLVELTDTGIGIPEKEQSKVFDAFYQVENSRSKDTEGTGLGLSIVKKLVEAHNGSIRLKSREGIGTSFYINLPILDKGEKKIQVRRTYSTSYPEKLRTHSYIRFECADRKNEDLLTSFFKKQEQDLHFPKNSGIHKKKMILFRDNLSTTGLPGLSTAWKTVYILPEENRMEGLGEDFDFYLSSPISIDELKLLLEKLAEEIHD
ncbi:PAS domain S-box protein [Leptospira langatensis]|uniref:histidine kinase n=1 Tax=Leptospira langatensis TaxID=2484983 RepID=A0A5F1ZYD6_9LEPT|nr:ATP-binding protein [Leptospira langatensis]TGK04218.1 PAS domain S-box protein [Leptospira langatensis]TGL43698.1 PAS domain S-box protein [Leptospira langatensis]